MVDHNSDREDRLLAELLAADPIADNGFSNRIVARIRQRLWLRRLAVPIAGFFGALIAYQPVAAFAGFVADTLRGLLLETAVATGPLSAMPSLPLIAAGGALFAVIAMACTLADR